MLPTTMQAGGESDTAPGNHLSLVGGRQEVVDKVKGKAERKADKASRSSVPENFCCVVCVV